MPVSYPHEPPKVKCTTKVYHPNIDLEGNVCLNILREDWKPVLSISSIVYGLQFLFLVSFPSAFSLYFSRTRELKGVDFANLTLACSIFFTGPKPRGPTKQGSGSDLERRPKAVPVKCQEKHERVLHRWRVLSKVCVNGCTKILLLIHSTKLFQLFVFHFLLFLLLPVSEIIYIVVVTSHLSPSVSTALPSFRHQLLESSSTGTPRVIRNSTSWEAGRETKSTCSKILRLNQIRKKKVPNLSSSSPC